MSAIINLPKVIAIRAKRELFLPDAPMRFFTLFFDIILRYAYLFSLVSLVS